MDLAVDAAPPASKAAARLPVARGGQSARPASACVYPATRCGRGLLHAPRSGVRSLSNRTYSSPSAEDRAIQRAFDARPRAFAVRFPDPALALTSLTHFRIEWSAVGASIFKARSCCGCFAVTAFCIRAAPSAVEPCGCSMCLTIEFTSLLPVDLDM